MPSKGLEQFLQMVISDPSLQAELKGISDETAFIEQAVMLGAQTGCHFTAEEARAKLQAGVPLAEQLRDLETVGGAAADDYMLHLGCNPKPPNRTGSYASGACVAIDAQASFETRQSV